MENEAIKIATSKVNPKESFTKDSWLVSILNTGSRWTGHAVIVIEGLEPTQTTHSELFVGQYDINAAVYKGENNKLNPKGYISKVRCHQDNKYYDKADYTKYTSRSWNIPRLEAKKIIQSIQADENKLKNDEKIEYQMFNLEKLLTPSSFASDKDDFENPQQPDAINCAEWCRLKLKEGGIEDVSRKAKPEKVASPTGCLIM